MNQQNNTVTYDLDQLLKMLKLSVCLEQYQLIAESCEKQGTSYVNFLHELMTREHQYRQQKRIQTLIKNAQLPRDKLLSDFDMTRIKGLSQSHVDNLAEGEFIDRCENILIFGNPGTGKTHLSIALAREWCLLGRRVRFCYVYCQIKNKKNFSASKIQNIAVNLEKTFIFGCCFVIATYSNLLGQSAIRGYLRRNTHKLPIRFIRCAPQTLLRGAQ